MAPTLIIHEPGRTALQLRLGLEPIEVGRDCPGLLLTDPGVSRRHLELRRLGEAVQVTELGTTNGSFVDEVIFTGARWLARGEVVRIGSTTLTLSLAEDRPSPAATAAVELSPRQSVSAPPRRARAAVVAAVAMAAVIVALAWPGDRRLAQPDAAPAAAIDEAAVIDEAAPIDEPIMSAVNRPPTVPPRPTPVLTVFETDFGAGVIEPEGAQIDSPVGAAATVRAALVRADPECAPYADAIASAPTDVRAYRYFERIGTSQSFSITLYRFGDDRTVSQVLGAAADRPALECAARAGVALTPRPAPVGLQAPWQWLQGESSVAVLLEVGPALVRFEHRAATGDQLASDAEIVRAVSLLAGRAG